MNVPRPFVLSVSLALAACTPADGETSAPDDDWRAALAAQVDAIDDETPGAMGVYAKRLADGGTLDHDAGRAWYLSSTIKIPVAIAVLQMAQEGKLSLEEQLELRESDFVDGAGSLIREPVGSRQSIESLLRRSIRDSDSVATDMLIRRLGEDELNRRIAQWTPGFGRITTIQQVRYDVYGSMHPKARELTAPQLAALRRAAAGEARLQALLRATGVPRGELKYDSIDAAFDAYYATGTNSATLAAFGTMLEKLARGELLDDGHRDLLLGHMRAITTGAKRIQAGLPKDLTFAQKTGTQHERACNVGLLYRGEDPAHATVVAVCLEDFGPLANAEEAMRSLGGSLTAAAHP